MQLNKLSALLFLLGAIGCFGLSQRQSFKTQESNRFGSPVGLVQTVHISNAGRRQYLIIGFGCLVGCLYNVAQIRNQDLR